MCIYKYISSPSPSVPLFYILFQLDFHPSFRLVWILLVGVYRLKRRSWPRQKGNSTLTFPLHLILPVSPCVRYLIFFLCKDNWQYGFDPHDDSDYLTISGNECYNNGESLRCWHQYARTGPADPIGCTYNYSYFSKFNIECRFVVWRADLHSALLCSVQPIKHSKAPDIMKPIKPNLFCCGPPPFAPNSGTKPCLLHPSWSRKPRHHCLQAVRSSTSHGQQFLQQRGQRHHAPQELRWQHCGRCGWNKKLMVYFSKRGLASSW